MTPDEKLRYCKICLNRKMDLNTGLNCGLTGRKPEFDPTCPDLKVDQPEADRLVKLEREAKEEEVQSGGFFAPEKQGIKKGVKGGLVMIGIAVVWFVGGLFAGYIFYYPPILFCIGIYAVIKGSMKKSEA